ncbi:MAG: hypothetical protein AAF844_17330 [Pseudomonadota bacterium]
MGIIGRAVGGVDCFKCSPAMAEWGEGEVGDEETLEAFLANQRKTVKGMKMS